MKILKKIRFAIATFLVLISFAFQAESKSQPKIEPETPETNNSEISEQSSAIEVWNSEKGLKYLEQSQYKNDFFELANFFQPQAGPTFCGIASAVIILNRLFYEKIPNQQINEIIKPNGEKIPFKLFTQDNFFNAQTEKIKPYSVLTWREPKKILKKDGKKEKIYDPGLTLDELASMFLRAYKISVKTNHFKNSSLKNIEKLRLLLKKTLVEKNNFVIVNFDGQILGLKSHGHFSPLVAYDQISDQVLIFDVSLHLNQWFWIPLPELAKAMNSKDGDQFRGFLIVSKSKN